ncbi:MAG: putative exported protein [Verrucomicrobiaceae bacterium]|nr:putative exported protein [Verrucomicrobiaceae bacterium]
MNVEYGMTNEKSFHHGLGALHSKAMRHPLLLITCILSAFFACACDGQSIVVAGKGEGSVWKVESATTHMYLCGTIHLLRESDYPLPGSYEVAYRDSKKLVFELPPGSQHDPQLAVRMRQAGSYPEGSDLPSKIRPETWDALADWCTKNGAGIGAFKPFRPWLAALTIAATEYAAVGAAPDRGVDSVFEERMVKDGKTGEGLETVDLQIGLFSKLTPKQQEQLLEQTLAEVKSLPDQFERMITAWRTGNVDDLNKMMFEEAKNYPDLMEIFLNKRNASWISKLQGYLSKNEPAMVLVGAGHLGGEGGVIALLKAKGYKVEKVKAD